MRSSESVSRMPETHQTCLMAEDATKAKSGGIESLIAKHARLLKLKPDIKEEYIKHIHIFTQYIQYINTLMNDDPRLPTPSLPLPSGLCPVSDARCASVTAGCGWWRVRAAVDLDRDLWLAQRGHLLDVFRVRSGYIPGAVQRLSPGDGVGRPSVSEGEGEVPDRGRWPAVRSVAVTDRWPVTKGTPGLLSISALVSEIFSRIPGGCCFAPPPTERGLMKQ